MESNLMAINTYHMTLNTSNVKTPDSWIECNRIGNLVMINGCAKITKAVNTYSVLNIASGAPVPCCNKQLYTVAIAQDNTYSNCFLEVSKSGAVDLLVRWQKASSGDIFYYEFSKKQYRMCQQELFRYRYWLILGKNRYQSSYKTYFGFALNLFQLSPLQTHHSFDLWHRELLLV